MNRAQLKTQAKALLKPQFFTVLLTGIVSGLVVALLNVIPVVGNIASIVIAGPLAMGAMLVYTTVTAGKTAQLEQLFEPFKTNFLTAFLANLISVIMIMLYSLLLVVPGIMKAYSYAMVPYVLRYEPELSAMDALHRSEDLMRGHRMELFMLELSFLSWLPLFIITVGLAGFWVGPYIEITQTLFYDRIYSAATH